ncbi:hypothetical protein [Levilactobacillus fujinensis]|uniref:Phage tail protein n=1 Tax=Levilactobacillus fujinensis TaxID=2486024 RepID=A0ABW1TKW7_9LACO|nr:hypothetical protein [Levilactobacillus fujinensis]
MKTSEFKKRVEEMGYSGWTTSTNDLVFESGTLPGSARVSLNRAGTYHAIDLPKRVVSVAQEFAWTPLAEREKRWNVVIGNFEDENGDLKLSVWWKGDHGEFWIFDTVALEDLSEPENIFTDTEFDSLVAYIKTQPNGDTYAKIAELGKREVR